MKQSFQLFQHGSLDVSKGIRIDDNLSFLSKEEIASKFSDYILLYNLDSQGHYIAMGNAGDCVIYKNGNIDQMSDSA